MYIIFKGKKSKRSQKAVGIKVFITFFCWVIEGSRSGAGSGPIPLTDGSGSGSSRPKNMWIRIRNTVCNNTNCCHIKLNVLLLFRLALVSCGGGVMTVYRSCTNPAPQGGGANCSGLARMDQACNVNPCPLESGQCSFFFLLLFVVPSLFSWNN
jgi:hypothetical protein